MPRESIKTNLSHTVPLFLSRGVAAVWLSVLSGCAWTPVVHHYPSGLTIARVDQETLNRICSKTDDNGNPVGVVNGCYDKSNDIIYLRNDAEGAEALIHELAHREGIADPKKGGFSWRAQ